MAWKDGSRQENSQVGCAIAWQEVEGHWTGLTTHMGTNKEIFDAELEAIGQAMRGLHKGTKPTDTTPYSATASQPFDVAAMTDQDQARLKPMT
jgi:hypothetical protein